VLKTKERAEAAASLPEPVIVISKDKTGDGWTVTILNAPAEFDATPRSFAREQAAYGYGSGLRLFKGWRLIAPTDRRKR
jgi:hypothetical protein